MRKIMRKRRQNSAVRFFTSTRPNFISETQANVSKGVLRTNNTSYDAKKKKKKRRKRSSTYTFSNAKRALQRRFTNTLSIPFGSGSEEGKEEKGEKMPKNQRKMKEEKNQF
eukprot:TRINITY_DN6535_c0_g1_i1.p1 TRINITY_DN6535_c0_g1~~TRINITY_DN6535_c0_g1_i1.p1  ORF type:complete len:111 (+),score=27.74 TRINITY_DN6535_c0_g1_i1:149-481(+)